MRLSQLQFELLQVECGPEIAFVVLVDVTGFVLAGMDMTREDKREPVVPDVELKLVWGKVKTRSIF